MPRGRPRKQPSISELQEMLRTQRGQRSKLLRERKSLATKLEQVDRQIAALDGGDNGAGVAGGVGRTRPRNDQPLPDVIASVLKKNGKPMRVGDITDGVLATGYTTTSANFRGIVNQALIKDDRFKQESRGYYKLA